MPYFRVEYFKWKDSHFSTYTAIPYYQPFNPRTENGKILK